MRGGEAHTRKKRSCRRATAMSAHASFLCSRCGWLGYLSLDEIMNLKPKCKYVLYRGKGCWFASSEKVARASCECDACEMSFPSSFWRGGSQAVVTPGNTYVGILEIYPLNICHFSTASSTTARRYRSSSRRSASRAAPELAACSSFILSLFPSQSIQ